MRSKPPRPQIWGSKREEGHSLRFPQNWGLGGLLIPLLLLTGCGDDRPVTYSAPVTAQAAPTAAPAPVTAAAPASEADNQPDPLLGNTNTNKPQADPLLSNDPLQGPKMPTEHSHWLRGRLRGAQVTVLLNGMRQGQYYGLVDRDITMSLRQGINSVTFVYQPIGHSSSAEMEVLESEHHPPIPPLVTFQSPPAAEDGKLTPVTQTFTFAAN